MKIPITILIAIITITQLLAAQNSDFTKQKFKKHLMFDPTRNAEKDIQDAIVEAKKSGKRILLDVGGEWCIWCHRLDSLFIQNKNLDKYLNSHYIFVKINVSKENKNEDVLSKYPKVAGYPHFFILDKNGILLHSQDTGELEYPRDYPLKGHDEKKVLAFLKNWAK